VRDEEQAVVPRVFGGAAATTPRHLRHLIDDQQFSPVFQPIIDLRSNQTVGYEAFTRFHDGISPELRFAQARHAGLGLDLELAALEAVAEQAGDLPVAPYLSVNLSAAALGVDRLAEVLGPTDARPLVLELTEHEPVSDYAGVRSDLAALARTRKLNRPLRLAVVDAGAGAASLHLVGLLPGVIKLDHGLVSGLDHDPALRVLVTGLVRFADEIGADVVGEGIEVSEEATALRRLGVRYGQGYLLGRPMPIDETEP
jgi:EAL domain-containing protein (putative c-di-GMP-specific phosphodiesterase class I)